MGRLCMKSYSSIALPYEASRVASMEKKIQFPSLRIDVQETFKRLAPFLLPVTSTLKLLSRCAMKVDPAAYQVAEEDEKLPSNSLGIHRPPGQTTAVPSYSTSRQHLLQRLVCQVII